MYAQSEVGNKNAYKTASKTLKEFEELNKIKSLDTSGEFGVEFNVKDCSKSEIGETKKGRGGKAH